MKLCFDPLRFFMFDQGKLRRVMKSYERVKKRYVTQVTKWLHNFFTTGLQRMYNFITIKIKEVVFDGEVPPLKVAPPLHDGVPPHKKTRGYFGGPPHKSRGAFSLNLSPPP